MTPTRFAVILVLALAPAAQGFAQETPEPSPSPATGQAGPAGESAAAPEREAPPEPARDDSPYDYQASEEISEDLSVSFPVDI